MPSSSARCAQLPRAADKVPFYSALKKFRDYLNGIIPHIDESECVFNDSKFWTCYDNEPKTTDNVAYSDITDISTCGTVKSNKLITMETSGNTVISDFNDQCHVKKKRGRPKKIRLEDSEEFKMTTPRRTVSQQINIMQYSNIAVIPKKKRGRPKKVKTEVSSGVSVKIPSNSSNEMKSGCDVFTNEAICNTGITDMCSNINQSRMFSPPMLQKQNSPNNSFCAIEISQNSSPSRYNSMSMNALTGGGANVNETFGTNLHHSHDLSNIQSYHQHSPQNSHSQQTFSHSDLSSEISAAISSENLGGGENSPTPTSPGIGPNDFEPPTSISVVDDNNTSNECVPNKKSNTGGFASPATSTHNEHGGGLSHLQQNTNSYSPYRSTPTNTYIEQRANETNDNCIHQTSQPIQQQQQNTNGVSNISNNLTRQSMNLLQIHNQHHEHHHHLHHQHHSSSENSTIANVALTTSNYVNKATDVAAKSISGLESLVEQIPNLNNSETLNSSNNNVSVSSESYVISNIGQLVENRIGNDTTANLLSEQYQNSCLYSVYPSNINGGSLISGGGGDISGVSNASTIGNIGSVFSNSMSHYQNPQFSPPNPSCASPSAVISNVSSSQSYGSLPSPFSVSSLTSSNYPTAAATMNSYHSNFMAASPHHLSGSTAVVSSRNGNGTAGSMYIEPIMPMPVNHLYHHHHHPYSQHSAYPGYGPHNAPPPPTIHMPSPNYPYGYSYSQAPHPVSHPSTAYLTNHHSMFDRIKPDIGYGGY